MSLRKSVATRVALLQIVIVTSALSVGLTLFAVHFVAPRQARAQPDVQGEIRATAFTLVGPDGAVIGRFGPWGLPGPAAGNGSLRLYTSAGVELAHVAALGLGGRVVLNQPGGNVRTALIGFQNPGLYLYDEEAQAKFEAGQNPSPRLVLGGTRRDGSYGLTTFEADGTLIAALPSFIPTP